MQVGDASRDGQAQAAARSRRLPAEEALAEMRQVGGRYAGTGIRHGQPDAVGSAGHGDPDFRAPAMAQGVAEQVTEKRFQQFRAPANLRVPVSLQFDIGFAAGQRLGGQLGDAAAHDGGEVQVRQLLRLVLLQAGQREQLLDEPAHAVAGAHHVVQSAIAQAVIPRRAGHLGLRTRRRHRLAQLVGCIGGEPPLQLRAAPNAVEQLVQPAHQRRCLGRHAAQVQWLERHRLARPHGLAKQREWPQRAAHAPADQQRQYRQCHGERHQRVEGDARRDRVADRMVLGHLDERLMVAIPEGENPPLLSGHLAVGKTLLDAAQPHARRRGRAHHQPRAVLPDLESDGLCILAHLGEVIGVELHQLVARLRCEHRGGLRKVCVEQPVGFTVSVDVGGHRGGQPGQRHGAEQQRQQPPLYRAARGHRRHARGAAGSLRPGWCG